MWSLLKKDILVTEILFISVYHYSDRSGMIFPAESKKHKTAKS